MPIYRPSNNKPFAGYNPAQRISGQMILSGTNPSYVSANAVFFLEMLQVDDTGSGVTLTDGAGNNLATTVKSFSQDQSPVRFDKGITITGTVIMAKGFIVEGIL